MGGLNSGVKHSRKATLEDSWALPAHEVVPKLGLAAATPAPLPLTVSYVVPGTGIPMSSTVMAESTRPFFGGLRWWWKCSCGRRVSALFLPSICATEFRCRVCHRLTYRSSQRHDSRVDYYRKHPEAGFQALRAAPSCVGQLFLVLRSLRLIGERGGVKAARLVEPSIGAS